MNAEVLHDYHVARHADELAREANDYGYAGDRARDKECGVKQPVTLKQWIAQVQPPKPSPDEERQAAIDEARSARDEAEAMVQVAAGYIAVYDGEVAALAKLGMSYTEIGQELGGVSKQRVGQYIARHKARTARR